MRNARSWWLAVAVLAPSVAVANPAVPFDDAARGARKVGRLDELVWAVTEACDRGSDVQRRQCRIVRDAAAKAVTGTPLLVDVEPSGFSTVPWSAATKSVALMLTACVACDLVVEGKRVKVVAGRPQVEGGALVIPKLFDNAIGFSDEASAARWLKGHAGARFQVVGTLASPPRWTLAGHDGISLDVTAWRVWVPCTGEVVLTSGKPGNVAPDKTACPAAPGARREGSP